MYCSIASMGTVQHQYNIMCVVCVCGVLSTNINKIFTNYKNETLFDMHC